MLNRGEIWLANLNPSQGTEPGKTRPVLVVQDQALIDAGHPSTLIVPLTTNVFKDAEPLRIHVPASSGIKQSSDLLIDQLRAIDNRRFFKGPIGRLPTATLKKVDDAICEVLGLKA